MPRVAGQEKTRNHKREEHKAQMSLLTAMEELRETRLDMTDSLVQIAQALIFCGLPYRRTNERQIERKTRASDGSTVTVTFTASRKDVDLPYGSDRTLLHWLIDKAIKTKSPFVSWEYASDFLDDMRLSKGGRMFTTLRQRFERLASMSITIHRASDTPEQFAMPVIRASRLPGSLTNGVRSSHRPEQVLGVQLDDLFFREVLQKHIPMSGTLLRITDQKPQMQDYMMFLAWRSFTSDAAKRETFIPWTNLREQMWQADTNTARIRSRFKQAISLLRVGWPELRAEAQTRGLLINPPKHGMHLLLGNAPRGNTPGSIPSLLGVR